MAIDDYGAGFGPFHYLKRIPFDLIKIDGSFVRDMPRSDADQLTVKAIVQIARGLGKSTIAEYVQDDRTTEMLREYGVDMAQGFHLGRPVDLDEMLGRAPDCLGGFPETAAEVAARFVAGVLLREGEARVERQPVPELRHDFDHPPDLAVAAEGGNALTAGLEQLRRRAGRFLGELSGRGRQVSGTPLTVRCRAASSRPL